MNFLGYTSNPLMGSFVPPSYALPQFGTTPGLRVPMQGSEPGLRVPMGNAPLKTQSAGLNGNLLGLGMDTLAAAQPQQMDMPQLGLLMPQSRADFRTLYANYLKEMGLLA